MRFFCGQVIIPPPSNFDGKTVHESRLTGTFFCVTTTAQSFPRTATDVRPPWFMALNAYSVGIKLSYLLEYVTHAIY